MDETSFCNHCKRNVPSATFTLHSTHCARFIEICKKCSEPVPKSELSDHENEVHSKVLCKICNMELEKGGLENHMVKACPGRDVTCKFCELVCTASNIGEHQIQCGNRTAPCDVCGNFILIRMMEAHTHLHKRSWESPVKSEPSAASQPLSRAAKQEKQDIVQSIPTGQQPRYRNVVCQNLFQAAASLPSQNGNPAHCKEAERHHKADNKGDRCSPGNGQMNADIESPVLLPCEFCQGNFTLDDLEEHQIVCSTAQTVERDRQRDFAFQFSENQREVDEDEEDYWSKYEEKPVQQSEEHAELEDAWLQPNVNEVKDNPESEEAYWSKYAAAPSNAADPPDEEEPSIPCELCGVPFPLSCLEIHFVACKFSNEEQDVEVHAPQPYKRNVFLLPCSICGKTVSSEELELHEAECGRFPGKRKEEHRNFRGHIETTEKYDVPKTPAPKFQQRKQHNMVPCSICVVAVPFDNIEMHEAQCARTPLERKVTPVRIPAIRKPASPPKNPRFESESQRKARENALLAAEVREKTNPVIRQSEMVVVNLPNGQQILKKRHNDADIDMGNVLGRGERYGAQGALPRMDPDRGAALGARPKHPLKPREPANVGDRSRFVDFAPGTPDRFKNPRAQPASPTQNIGSKQTGIANGGGVIKKPNSAFKKNAYDPDPGHVLGGDGNRGPPRAQPMPRNGRRVKRDQNDLPEDPFW